MQKLKKLVSRTTNSRTYKSAYYKIVCRCPICSANKGCNKRKRNVKNKQRTWKKYRKTKYK